MKKPKVTKKPKITIEKEWQTVRVSMGDVSIDADFNYETKKYYLSHGTNDMSVTFKADIGSTESIEKHINRAKCVIATLEYIKKELAL